MTGALATTGALDLIVRETMLAENRLRRADHTNRAYIADVKQFQQYLEAVGHHTGDLNTRLEHWRDITHAHIKTYQLYMMEDGYAYASVNRRISALKSMCRSANQAGEMDSSEYLRISQIKSFSHAEATRADAKRQRSRKGRKKRGATIITPAQARALKHQPRYDRATLRTNLVMCLLLDHACRASEVVKFTTNDVKGDRLLIHRIKTAEQQRHVKTDSSRYAIDAWLAAKPQQLLPTGAGPLVCNLKTNAALTERQVYRLVKAAGKGIGLEGLSPHDCRHYFATEALRAGSRRDAVRSAGNWASDSSLQRYVEEIELSNEEVILP